MLSLVLISCLFSPVLTEGNTVDMLFIGKQSCATDGRTLQPCIIDQIPVGYYELIHCVHDEENIQRAFSRCNFGNLDKDRLQSCASGTKGRELLSRYQGTVLDRLASIGLSKWTYPVLLVDDVRNREMETSLLGELRDRILKPRPQECDPTRNEPKFW